MVNALFDKGRRERLRDAVKRGRLAEELRQRLPEPAFDTAPTQVYSAEPPSNSPATPPPLQRNPAMDTGFVDFRRPQIAPNPLDESLFEAIRKGDAGLVVAAIRNGANVNARLTRIPSHRQGDCIMTSEVSPLTYAKAKGNPVIVGLLERYGAKD
jgi:hypothetical protein